jgi:hypothetical protein
VIDDRIPIACTSAAAHFWLEVSSWLSMHYTAMPETLRKSPILHLITRSPKLYLCADLVYVGIVAKLDLETSLVKTSRTRSQA